MGYNILDMQHQPQNNERTYSRMARVVFGAGVGLVTGILPPLITSAVVGHVSLTESIAVVTLFSIVFGILNGVGSDSDVDMM